MTNKQIVEKVIQKAIDGGWSDGNAALAEVGSIPNWAIPTPVCIAIIFSHDFAKALWGENQQPFTLDKPESFEDDVHIFYRPKWQVMIMQMVIADDPIKYLEEYLDRELFKGEKQ